MANNLTANQQAAVLTLIQAVGDLPDFITQVQQVYTANFQSTRLVALSGIALTVADWTVIPPMVAAAEPNVLMPLLNSITTDIGNSNATNLGAKLMMLFCVVKKYVGA